MSAVANVTAELSGKTGLKLCWRCVFWLPPGSPPVVADMDTVPALRGPELYPYPFHRFLPGGTPADHPDEVVVDLYPLRKSSHPVHERVYETAADRSGSILLECGCPHEPPSPVAQPCGN
jgi:hypothetical protein